MVQDPQGGDAPGEREMWEGEEGRGRGRRGVGLNNNGNFDTHGGFVGGRDRQPSRRQQRSPLIARASYRTNWGITSAAVKRP